jgi:hypothetical protein
VNCLSCLYSFHSTFFFFEPLYIYFSVCSLLVILLSPLSQKEDTGSLCIYLFFKEIIYSFELSVCLWINVFFLDLTWLDDNVISISNGVY